MLPELILERLDKNKLPLPEYKSAEAAGFDFAACLTRPYFWVQPGRTTRAEYQPPELGKLAIAPESTYLIPLGFKVEFPVGYVLKLYVRSSVGLAGLRLANGTGIIDSDYRGELFAALHNDSIINIEIEHGQRLIQALLEPVQRAALKEGKVNETARGEGGFGSTGTTTPVADPPH